MQESCQYRFAVWVGSRAKWWVSDNAVSIKSDQEFYLMYLKTKSEVAKKSITWKSQNTKRHWLIVMMAINGNDINLFIAKHIYETVFLAVSGRLKKLFS
jgi:hypothetical protein